LDFPSFHTNSGELVRLKAVGYFLTVPGRRFSGGRID
jgi:hypothetical protein